MANVKLTNKIELDKLQAKIVLLFGQKITQQELLDKCISYSNDHFNEFLTTEFDFIRPTDEIISKIKNSAIESGFAHPELSDDELIYGP